MRLRSAVPEAMDHCGCVRPIHAGLDDHRTICCHLFHGEAVNGHAATQNLMEAG